MALPFGTYMDRSATIASGRAGLNEQSSQLRRSIGAKPRQQGFKLAKTWAGKVADGTWTAVDAKAALAVAVEQLDAWIDAHHADAVTAPAETAWPQAAAQGTA